MPTATTRAEPQNLQASAVTFDALQGAQSLEEVHVTIEGGVQRNLGGAVGGRQGLRVRKQEVRGEGVTVRWRI